MPNFQSSPISPVEDAAKGDGSAINYEAIRAHTNEQYGPPRMIRGVVAQPESQPALAQELPDTMHQLSPETVELYRVSVKEAGAAVTSARLTQLANANA